MTRLQPTDCLTMLYEDLRRQARTVSLCDADGREAWKRACIEVLAAVPDLDQRAAWAIMLADALPAARHDTVHVTHVAAWLLKGAQP